MVIGEGVTGRSRGASLTVLQLDRLVQCRQCLRRIIVLDRPAPRTIRPGPGDLGPLPPSQGCPTPEDTAERGEARLRVAPRASVGHAELSLEHRPRDASLAPIHEQQGGLQGGLEAHPLRHVRAEDPGPGRAARDR